MKLPARKARGPELPVADESRRIALEAFEKIRGGRGIAATHPAERPSPGADHATEEGTS